jgi:hypothetical protein
MDEQADEPTPSPEPPPGAPVPPPGPLPGGGTGPALPCDSGPDEGWPDESWPPRDDDRVPEPWELEGPAVSISLGDATELDPALLAAICGPDGLGGALSPQFAQDQAADALRPTPVLAALTEQAVTDVTSLTDDQLMGVLQAARRLENRINWQQTVAVAELGRRRDAQLQDARARRAPAGQRRGEFPADELASELLITAKQASNLLEAARQLTGRLPATLAGMADGTITVGSGHTIAYYTGSLSDADAAYADQVLAAVAPGLREDQLARKAAALEMKLDPEAARLRKEHARDTRQRVEARRELSGNASLSGRELDTADVMASKAHITALAHQLRRAGLDGTLDALRARVLADLTSGRNPLDRITPHLAEPHPGAPSPDTRTAPPEDRRDDEDSHSRNDDDNWPVDDNCDDEDETDSQGSTGGPSSPSAPAFPTTPMPPGTPAPFSAVINLIVPIGTLLGWSTTPSQAGTWGLLDPADTQDVVAAASLDPRTRWCATITGKDGTAIAHGCSPGRHPWQPAAPSTGSPPPTAPPPTPPPRTQPAPGTRDTRPDSGPDAAQAEQLRDLLRQLKFTPEPIARRACDHRHAEDRYTPSRKLAHLIRARTTTCDAPGCNAQAIYADLDHTVPHPDGPTDECNLGPKCRRHHRAKQAPGWRLEQTEPGVMRWTLPSGRTHTTTPTIYDT